MFVYFAMLGGAAGDRGTPPLAEDELKKLVRLARDGDRFAQQRLYEQLVHRVFRAVRPMFVSEAEAEDVTQDTLLKALTSLDRYAPRPGSAFASWVLAIAFNTARRRFRRRRAVPTEPEALAEMLDEEIVGSLEEEVDRKRERAMVLRALWQVPERERQILSLRYGAELESAEVAAVVGLSASNVRKICERWRGRLREQLDEQLGRTPEEGEPQ